VSEVCARVCVYVSCDERARGTVWRESLAVHLSLCRSAPVLLPRFHLVGHLTYGHTVPAWDQTRKPIVKGALNEGVLEVVLSAQLAAHAGDAVAAAAAGQAPVHAYVLANVAHDDAAAAGCLDAHLRREHIREP
jgi:hypothetical protein